MRRFRCIIFLLLAIFMTDVVLAAPVGMRTPLASDGAAPAMHCHMDASDGPASTQATHHHDGSPAHGNCHGCMACVSMLTEASDLFPTFAAVSAQNPHCETSYLSFVGRLPHRPPISA